MKRKPFFRNVPQFPFVKNLKFLDPPQLSLIRKKFSLKWQLLQFCIVPKISNTKRAGKTRLWRAHLWVKRRKLMSRLEVGIVKISLHLHGALWRFPSIISIFQLFHHFIPFASPQELKQMSCRGITQHVAIVWRSENR